MSEKTISLISRVFFLAAFVLLALAVFEAAAGQMGYTILRGKFTPGRLLEHAVILLVFVVTILLRQIRDRVTSA